MGLTWLELVYRQFVMRSDQASDTRASERATAHAAVIDPVPAWHLTQQGLREVAHAGRRAYEGEVVWAVDVD